LVRYADDLVILCHKESDAQEALRRLGIIMERLSLNLHPTKTRMVNLKEGHEGFDFLGFHLRKVVSWRWRQKYLERWPRHKAMNSVWEKLRAITGARHGFSKA
jgi:RNA-directed DNA polymerase